MKIKQKEISMKAIPGALTINAARARSAGRRGRAGRTALVALVSAAPAGADSPAALVAHWDLGPTALQLRWRLSGAPRADDAPCGDSAA